MTPFEEAVEVAAKGIWADACEKFASHPHWDELTPFDHHGLKEVVLPAVQALQDAGLLKEQA